MYHYAGNNPIKYTDPDGREDWDESGSSCTITADDKLWKISENFNNKHGTNISYDDVAKANGIENPNLIIAGNKLDFSSFISTTNTENSENFFGQGLIGATEILSGLACDILTTLYVAGREAASLKMQGKLDPSVGAEAMSGYTIGAILMADGINMLSSAINQTKSEPVFWTLFEDIFLSSTYQDIGEAVELYQKREKNEK